MHAEDIYNAIYLHQTAPEFIHRLKSNESPTTTEKILVSCTRDKVRQCSLHLNTYLCYVCNAILIYLFFTDFNSGALSWWYHTDIRETTGTAPGTWIWGDNSLLNYDPWTPLEPNTPSYLIGVIDKRDALMKDWDELSTINFICEK